KSIISKDIHWLISLLDSKDEGESAAKNLTKVSEYQAITLVLEPIMNRLEAGNTAWAVYIFENLADRVDISSYYPRMASVAKSLFKYPAYDSHQRVSNQQQVGIELLRLIVAKVDLDKLLVSYERHAIKTALEKIVTEHPYLKVKTEKIFARL
ncbi:MAG: hypothetical protein GY951_05225, partial [Psychromonas sp.]|nr:hypothetical protein [Psychromonas sp.]